MLCLCKAHTAVVGQYAISSMKNVGVFLLSPKWFVKSENSIGNIASNVFRVQPMSNRSNSMYWRNINWFKVKKPTNKVGKKSEEIREWGGKNCVFIFCRPARQPHTDACSHAHQRRNRFLLTEWQNFNAIEIMVLLPVESSTQWRSLLFFLIPSFFLFLAIVFFHTFSFILFICLAQCARKYASIW